MRLTYRTPAPKSPNDIDLDAEGRQVPVKSWDAGCPWADWHSLDDPVKGTLNTSHTKDHGNHNWPQ